jgi:hypothetical protein
MPERMQAVGRSTAAAHSEQKQQFISGIGSGMVSLSHHGRASGLEAGYQFDGGDRDIGNDRRINHLRRRVSPHRFSDSGDRSGDA